MEAEVTNSKHAEKGWKLYAIILSLIILGVIFQLISNIFPEHGEKGHATILGPDYDKFFHSVFHDLAIASFAVGILELLAHTVFNKYFLSDVRNEVDFAFQKTNNLTKTYLLKENNLYRAGIVDCTKKLQEHFLDIAISHFKENAKPEKVVRMMLMYLPNASNVSTKEKILELINMGVRIEIVLPDYKDSMIQNELNMRWNNYKRRPVEKIVQKTSISISEIKILYRSLDEQQRKYLSLRLHKQFIAFPLLNFGTVWYKGSYIYNIDAEEGYFLRVEHHIPGDLGSQLSDHYKGYLDDNETFSPELDEEQV